MKKITEIRSLNLQRLAKEYGSQRLLADALDTTPGYVNQLLTGHRDIGEKSARNIENKLGLAEMALDAPISELTDLAIKEKPNKYIPVKINPLSQSKLKLIDEISLLFSEDIDPLDMIMIQQLMEMLKTKYLTKK